ncbi:MAG: hypothetical protein EPO51_17185 [Phenylobacterium sp.]|uniref:DUF6958 family protein n=1 Tax=Phenylobacterium sp. TaxID=1871053 RepID=UPI00122530BA|nr:hypothetical protein [Phenylobacterium sp.]TAJ70808.1 MAG: hypothetical protein EPO51_17185 [Phenylobacterium sp.]
MKAETILVENVASPDSPPRPVNREKYEATREAVMAALPTAEPGLSYAELKAAALPRLPEALFPGGQTVGWWLKCVQLDLEAKGVIVRHSKPLRWYRAA